MIPLTSPWPLVAGALMTAAAGFAGGYALSGRLADGRIARMDARRIECEQAREKDARAAAEAAAALLARAQHAEAQAAARLAAAEAASRKKIEETRREIYRIATGRECLPDALRLRLNAAIAAADGLPARAADTDPEPAGPAADTAVALWIADAVDAYDACRARLDAIRQWDEVTHGR